MEEGPKEDNQSYSIGTIPLFCGLDSLDFFFFLYYSFEVLWDARWVMEDIVVDPF